MASIDADRLGGVSVVIPAYNAARYLPEAIDSVLAQTVGGLEIIVVDDGSTDDTTSLAGRYGSEVRWIRQPNQGVSAARNAGIARARGAYVGFLDADDAWLPGKIERQLEALATAAPRCGACHTGLLATGGGPDEVYGCATTEGILVDLLFRGNTVRTPSTIVCERRLLDRVGGFDTHLSVCADWDLWIRLASITDFVCVDEPLVRYRRHADNMSRNVALLELDSRRVLEKAFATMQLPEWIRRNRASALARNDIVLAGSYFRARCLASFLRCTLRALLRDPRQARYLAATPHRWASRIRERKGRQARRRRASPKYS